MSIRRFIERVAYAFWLGEMLFFAFIFAPRVFKVLPRESAALLQNALFPAYFKVGIVCGTLMLLLRAPVRRGVSDRVVLALTGLALGIFVFGLLYVVPALQARLNLEIPAEANETFRSLHRLSVGTNLLALLALLGVAAVGRDLRRP